jgi:uncharacterized protein YraI
MLTTKRALSLLVAGLCLSIGLMLLSVVGDTQVASAQTWPTRTPTPDPNEPPPPPPPPGDPTAQPEPPGDPGVQPTETAAVATVAVATTAVATREMLPTAGACGEPPTAQAQTGVNVRTGPGTQYGVESGLLTGEVRPIVGRAGNAQWWLIELAGGKLGWVADRTVTVQGYTGNVPLVAAPAIGNVTPTPGPAWQPTPNPMCALTATATPPAGSASQSTGSDEVQATPTAMSSTPTAAVATATEDTATEAGATPLPESTESPQADQVVTPTTAVMQSAAPTATPLNTTRSNGGTSWILFTGIGLLLLSAVTFVLFRRRG